MSDCKHDGIATYRLLDGTPAGMWGCTQCARKFVPLDTPTMTIDGVAYVEAPEPEPAQGSNGNYACESCALNMTKACVEAIDGMAENAFGGNCYVRDVIYIRADNSVSDRLQQFGSM